MKAPREGTRVRFEPNPASYALYSNPPKKMMTGTVETVPLPGGRKTYFPGPGGGLVYVKWDDGHHQGVSPIDLVLVSSGKHLAGLSGFGWEPLVENLIADVKQLMGERAVHLGFNQLAHWRKLEKEELALELLRVADDLEDGDFLRRHNMTLTGASKALAKRLREASRKIMGGQLDGLRGCSGFSGFKTSCLRGQKRLKTETNTAAMQKRVVAAFEASDYCPPDGNFETVFEHGQWWVLYTDEDSDTHIFSVVDAEGGSAIDGFDFERV